MKTAKTKSALLTLADQKKATKDKEEREKKKEQLRKAEMAEIKRSEEEAKRQAKQQQMIEEEKKKEEEERRKKEELEKERMKKIDEQRRQEEALRVEKQRVERQEQEKLRRQAEEKERERQKNIEQKKKEMERERIERQKVEMEKLRLKEAEKAAAAAAAAKRKAEEEAAAKAKMDDRPKPILPVLPNLNSTYEVNSAAAATAAALNSTYNAGAAAKALNSTYNAGAKAADATFEVAEHDASSYDMTPKRLPTPATVENYVIDDLASDDETDDEDNPRKKIPAWAEKQQLRPALVKQTYKPPNLAKLFGVIEPPDLTQIFTGQVKKKYIRRGSSGIWYCPILPPGDYSDNKA